MLLDMSTGQDIQSSRDGNVAAEIINAVTIIDDPRNNIVESDLRKLSKKYMIGELMWYLAADNTLKGIQNYTKAWDRMSDDGEVVNSNYGHKIHKFYGFDQWEYVKNLLKADPNSRQAVIHIKNPMDYKTKDTPCTVCLQFFIREGKLFLTTYMRSNDVWFGFPYDVFNFTCFQIRMAMELGVGIGSYTHIAGSLHLYQRDLDKFLDRPDTEAK
jgi:thymidylate synthase